MKTVSHNHGTLYFRPLNSKKNSLTLYFITQNLPNIGWNCIFRIVGFRIFAHSIQKLTSDVVYFIPQNCLLGWNFIFRIIGLSIFVQLIQRKFCRPLYCPKLSRYRIIKFKNYGINYFCPHDDLTLFNSSYLNILSQLLAWKKDNIPLISHLREKIVYHWYQFTFVPTIFYRF